MQSRTIVNGNIIRRRVDSHALAEEILSNWCSTIQELWLRHDIAAAPLGYAMPGPFDYQHGICLIKGLDKYEALYGMNIRADLAERLGLPKEDICFRNDAEAFLEGELFCGAAAGATNVIGIILGTCLSTAVCHNGITADGKLSVTPYKGEIIEEAVSTRGIVRNYERLSGRKLKDVKAVAELYYSDINAREAFRLFATALAWFLQYFIQQENPDILVVDGNIMQAWDLYMLFVLQQLAATLPPLPVIAKAMLGENGIRIWRCQLLFHTTIPHL